MNAMSITQIYNYLASVFGKETADKHIIYLEQMNGMDMENKSQLPATKEDLQKEISRLELKIGDTKVDLSREIANNKVELTEQIANNKVELTEQIQNVRVELTEQIQNVRVDLTKLVVNVKSDLIKWMFIFWVGQAGIILGILLHFLMK